MSLSPAAARLSKLLRREVIFVEEPVGEGAAERVAGDPDHDLFLLENIRFYPGEASNDPGFARELARLGDYYVNDAFGTAHRAHASTAGVPGHLSPAVAGLLMESEIGSLSRALSSPEKPFVAIIGGAKISGKIDVVRNLFGRVDALLIGGAMANTFLAAKGLSVGRSVIDEARLDVASDLLRESDDAGCTLVLPCDCVVTDSLEGGGPGEVVGAGAIPDDRMAVDIGPRTLEEFRQWIVDARTIVWNGPMGVFEVEAFSRGTVAVAKMVAESTVRGAYSLLGGGDSVAAVRRAGIEKEISHISTGGGASLEFLAGNVLPGVEALSGRGEEEGR
jgi:phosphoglycerate kinase